MSLDRFRPGRASPDYLYIGLAIAMIGVGLAMISSASVVLSVEQTGSNYYYLTHQLIWLALGAVVFLVVSRIDYHLYERYALHIMAATLLLLVVVLIPGLGHSANGAQRWINLGGFQLQPSEIAKIALIIYLSSWLSRRGREIKTWSGGFWPFVFIVGVLAVFLAVLQRDMGTFMIVALTASIMYLMAGASLSQFLAGAIGASIGVLGLIKIEPYRFARLTVFLNPTGANSLTTGYHIRQALIAVGSGGWWGRGFGRSLQKYLYLPEPHTDSIFAITVEELGFVRSTLIVILIAAFILRGYRIAGRAGDDFGRMLAFGITTSFAVQAIVNIGAMLSVLPLTGVPLPFISYGGTSLVMSLIGVGIVVNISRQGYAQ